MRRLARHLFTLCSAMSMVLCVAACVLWVRSFSAMDHVDRAVPDLLGEYDRAVTSARGSVHVHWNQYPLNGDAIWRWRRFAADLPVAEGEALAYRFGPFGFERNTDPDSGLAGHDLRLPHWALAATSAVLPTAWLWSRRKRGPTPRPTRKAALMASVWCPLLLCAAASVLWARSYWANDYVAIQGEDESGDENMLPTLLGSDRGRLYVLWTGDRDEAWTTRSPRVGTRSPTPEAAFAGQSWWQRLGFDYRDYSQAGLIGLRGRLLSLPHFAAVALLGLPPLVWACRRWVRNRHKRAGLCPSCGYDLRATPDRCPECGTPAT